MVFSKVSTYFMMCFILLMNYIIIDTVQVEEVYKNWKNCRV